jgi:hypothetical protein
MHRVVLLATGVGVATYMIGKFVNARLLNQHNASNGKKTIILSDCDFDVSLNINSAALEDEIRMLAMQIFTQWKHLKDIKVSRISGGLTNAFNNCTLHFFFFRFFFHLLTPNKTTRCRLCNNSVQIGISHK